MHPAVYQFKELVDKGHFEHDPWKNASLKHQKVANTRRVLVEQIQSLCLESSLNSALGTFENSIRSCSLSLNVKAAIDKIGTPSKGTLRNWLKAFESKGQIGLLPKYNGSERAVYGWEAAALELFHRPQKPSLSKVVRDLKDLHGFRGIQEHNVRYFFSTLPSDLQERSPWRMGRKQYNDALREHIKRTTENLPVGVLFQGDGHCIDSYLRHPKSGKNTWRPELVLFMDVKSRYIPGWYLNVAESSINTMAALSHAMGSFNHVPAMVHIDNGSGFKSKMMNHETTGFYSSFGIEPLFALPGNAKSKNVERFFRTMEDDFGKDFDTYCGYDMSPDSSRHFNSEKMMKLQREGKLHVPTVEEWVTQFTAWLERYHNRPHPEFKDTTPAQLWATLETVPVVDKNLLIRPRAEVKVTRSLVTLHKRMYRSDFLYQLEGKELIAEYDLHDDTSIRLFDKDGKWLTVATLKSKKDYIPTSRIEEAQRNRLKAQQKRLDNKKLENEMQAGFTTPLHVDQTNDLSALEQSIDELAQAQQAKNDDFNFDEVAQDMIQSTDIDELDETDDEGFPDLLNS